jgi:transposase
LVSRLKRIHESPSALGKLNRNTAPRLSCPRRIPPLAIDLEMCKRRHLIENFFGKLKEFKRIALRADKTDQSFAAMLYLRAGLAGADGAS